MLGFCDALFSSGLGWQRVAHAATCPSCTSLGRGGPRAAPPASCTPVSPITTKQLRTPHDIANSNGLTKAVEFVVSRRLHLLCRNGSGPGSGQANVGMLDSHWTHCTGCVRVHRAGCCCQLSVLACVFVAAAGPAGWLPSWAPTWWLRPSGTAREESACSGVHGYSLTQAHFDWVSAFCIQLLGGKLLQACFGGMPR